MKQPGSLVAGAAEMKDKRGFGGPAVGRAAIEKMNLGCGLMIRVELYEDVARIPMVKASHVEIRAKQHPRDIFARHFGLGGSGENLDSAVVAGRKAKHDVVSQLADGFFVRVYRQHGGLLWWAHTGRETAN